MNFKEFLDYAWLLSALLTVVIAVNRKDTLLEAFVPTSLKMLFWQCIVVVWAVMMWALYLAGRPPILGQHPLNWARFLMLGYLWSVFGNYHLHGE